jgi:DNA (cytosine-5)-methyltransferase 1
MKYFAEFFAGVGLVREGLSSSGWECTWANDISEQKEEIYKQNYGGEHFFLEDIWNIVDSPSIVPDNVFLYTASFPCTDVSLAGGRLGLAGKQSGTINALMRILSNKGDSKPNVVLLENVKGFLTSNKGKDVAETTKALCELGYFVDILELDASLFTPQSRPRVFVLAIQEELARQVMIINDQCNVFSEFWNELKSGSLLRSSAIQQIIEKNINLNWGLFRTTRIKKKSHDLSEIIEISIPGEADIWWDKERKQRLYDQMSEKHRTSLAFMIDSPKISYGTVYRRVRAGKSMAELRTDGLAGCLRTPKGGSSKQILIEAGKGEWRVRFMTAREYARLQGVRDTFKLPINSNAGYFAMGDAVCVPVIEYIAENYLNLAYDAWIKNKHT